MDLQREIHVRNQVQWEVKTKQAVAMFQDLSASVFKNPGVVSA